MKIKSLFMLMTVALFTVSCSDDDDDAASSAGSGNDTEEEVSLGAAVEGTYSGYTSTTFPYISYAMACEDENLLIADAGDSTVDITLTSSTWGTYEILGAAVSGTGGSYTIAETSGTGTLTGHSGSASTYDITMSGTVTDGEATITITVAALMGGTTIVFHTGDAPAAALAQGSYSGYTSTTFAYISYAMTCEDESVLITSSDDSTVDVTLTSSTWGTYVISGAAISGTDGSYTIAETSGTGTMTGHSGSTSTYDITMSGTVTDGEATLTITVAALMGGTTIVFHTGDAPAAALVTGSYSGNLALSVATIDCGSTSTSITLIGEDDGSVTLTLGAFSMEVAAMGSTISLGDIAIPDVTVTDNGDDTYSLSCESFTVSDVDYGDSSTITVTGSLSGAIDADGNLSVSFSLIPGSMPMAITAEFTMSE